MLLACAVVCARDGLAKNTTNKNLPDKNLKVVIIRHGEKSADKSDGGDNLSCQGQNRALQLPVKTFAKPAKLKKPL